MVLMDFAIFISVQPAWRCHCRLCIYPFRGRLTSSRIRTLRPSIFRIS